MSNYAFNYSFNVTGNCNAVVQEISNNVENLRSRVERTTGAFSNMEKSIIVFNQASQWVNGLKQSLEQTLAPGAALNASLWADFLRDILATIEAIELPYNFVENYRTTEKYNREISVKNDTRELITKLYKNNKSEKETEGGKTIITERISTPIKISAYNDLREAVVEARQFLNEYQRTIYGEKIISEKENNDETRFLEFKNNIRLEKTWERIMPWIERERNGQNYHSAGTHPEADLGVKNTESRSAVQSIISWGMDTYKVKEYTRGIVEWCIKNQILKSEEFGEEREKEMINLIEKNHNDKHSIREKFRTVISTDVGRLLSEYKELRIDETKKPTNSYEIGKLIETIIINNQGEKMEEGKITIELERAIETALENILMRDQ